MRIHEMDTARYDQETGLIRSVGNQETANREAVETSDRVGKRHRASKRHRWRSSGELNRYAKWKIGCIVLGRRLRMDEI